MSEKEYILKAAFCDETHTVGFILDGVDVPDGQISVAHEARLIAHDIADHQFGLENIGTVEDEFSALGGYHVNSEYSSEYHHIMSHNGFPTGINGHASDLISIARDLVSSGATIEPFNTKEARELEFYSEYFEEAIEKSREGIVTEIEDLAEDEGTDVDGLLRNHGVDGIDGYLKAAKHHFYIGVEKALSERDFDEAYQRKEQCKKVVESAMSEIKERIDIFGEENEESVDVANEYLVVTIKEDKNGEFSYTTEEPLLAEEQYYEVADKKSVVIGTMKVKKDLEMPDGTVLEEGNYDLMINEDTCSVDCDHVSRPIGFDETVLVENAFIAASERINGVVTDFHMLIPMRESVLELLMDHIDFDIPDATYCEYNQALQLDNNGATHDASKYFNHAEIDAATKYQSHLYRDSTMGNDIYQIDQSKNKKLETASMSI